MKLGEDSVLRGRERIKLLKGVSGLDVIIIRIMVSFERTVFFEVVVEVRFGC